MSSDIAFHWSFLLIALITFVGSVLARIAAEIPPVFRIVVIGGLLGGFIFYRLLRKRRN